MRAKSKTNFDNFCCLIDTLILKFQISDILYFTNILLLLTKIMQAALIFFIATRKLFIAIDNYFFKFEISKSIFLS